MKVPGNATSHGHRSSVPAEGAKFTDDGGGRQVKNSDTAPSPNGGTDTRFVPATAIPGDRAAIFHSAAFLSLKRKCLI